MSVFVQTFLVLQFYMDFDPHLGRMLCWLQFGTCVHTFQFFFVGAFFLSFIVCELLFTRSGSQSYKPKRHFLRMLRTSILGVFLFMGV